MPRKLSKLPTTFWNNFMEMSFSEISYQVAKHTIGSSIPEDILKDIVYEAINFEAPIVHLHDNIYSLELFHGPTLAFKDFGARFMSRVMKHFKDDDKKLYILVATSGDTGGAVASGFYDVEGIEVVILFPKDKVSPLQQKQLTTLGRNITAIEIDGTFDDCQAIVKTSFLDPKMNEKYQLSSANSINISRLIPQSFYYFYTLRQLGLEAQASFVVPSGNFGNITAGILAQQMGMPVKHFVAATNVNDIVPHYITTGNYEPRPSQATISNAMDVGRPSNFPRIKTLYGSTWNTIKENMKGYSYTDDATKITMKEIHNRYKYILDPHGAVGYQAAIEYKRESNHAGPIVFLETAHPSKFKETVEQTLGLSVEVPRRLSKLEGLVENYISLDKTYESFRAWALENF